MTQHSVTLEQSIQLEGHILGNAPRPNEGRDQGRKVFTCHVCSKKFNQSCNLKTHMRIHTGERPFECPECGRFFTNKVNLQTHMRTHTGEKPFVCVVCSTQFTQVCHFEGMKYFKPTRLIDELLVVIINYRT